MKKHAESRTKTLVICSFIISIIAILFSIISLCPSIPRALNDDNLQFDYLGLIIGVLSLLITVLIGWNIFQMIDFKEKTNQIDELKDEFAKRINEIEIDSQFHKALDRSYRSQNAGYHFAQNDKEMTKFIMIVEGIKALRLFSELPNCKNQISKLSSTLIRGLKNSSSTKLGTKEKTLIIMICGNLKNKERIPNFNTIIDLINHC